MGHQHITCLGSQFLVPAVSHRMSATGMQRDWGLTSSDNSHRANRWCFSPLTYSCVHFRGQKGGPVNPVSFKYSSPSKVNAPAKPVGQEKAEGGRDVGLWGGTQMGSTTPVGLVLPFALTLLDKAVSLSLCLSSGSRCQLFSCPEFWLHRRALKQCFPFSLQQPSTELSACYCELTKVNHCVLSQLPKLAEVAKLGLVCRTFFLSPLSHPPILHGTCFAHDAGVYAPTKAENNQGCA